MRCTLSCGIEDRGLKGGDFGRPAMLHDRLAATCQSSSPVIAATRHAWAGIVSCAMADMAADMARRWEAGAVV